MLEMQTRAKVAEKSQQEEKRKNSGNSTIIVQKKAIDLGLNSAKSAEALATLVLV